MLPLGLSRPSPLYFRLGLDRRATGRHTRSSPEGGYHHHHLHPFVISATTHTTPAAEQAQSTIADDGYDMAHPMLAGPPFTLINFESLYRRAMRKVSSTAVSPMQSGGARSDRWYAPRL